MITTQEELQTFFEAIPDAMLLLDGHGTIIQCNTAASALLDTISNGQTIHSFAPTHLRQLSLYNAHGEPLGEENSPITRLLLGEALTDPETSVIRLPLQDGKEHYFHVSGKAQRDLNTSAITGALIVLRDVTLNRTQHHRLEETLFQRLHEQRAQREHEQRAQHISHLTSGIAADYAYVYQITPNGQLRCEWASDAIVRITGYTATEMDEMGWELLHLYHTEDLPAITARMAAMHSGTADVQEWRLTTRTGELRWLRDACHSERDPHTGIVRIYGVAEDITARKQSEAQIHQLSQQLSVTFDAMTDGILILSPEGRLLQMNHAAREFGTFSGHEDFISSPLQDWITHLAMRDENNHPMTLEQSPPYRVLHGEIFQGNHTVDVQITALNGREFFLNVSGSPIKAHEGQLIGAVLILRDVTERRRQQRRTQQALHTLLKISSSLAEFPAHEPEILRGPQLVSDPLYAKEVMQVLAQACELFNSQQACMLTITPHDHRMRTITSYGFSDTHEQALRDTMLNHPISLLLNEEEYTLLKRGDTFFPLQTQTGVRLLITAGIIHPLVAPLCIGEVCQGLLIIDGSHLKQTIRALQEEMALFKAIGRLAALIIERERLIQERTEAHSRTIAEREVSQQKDAFISLASHELRTPLATIKASIQITRRRLKRLANPDQHVSIAQIVKQVEEMLTRGERQAGIEHQLVENLLQVSRIQEQGLELKPELFNLLDVVHQAIEGQQHEENTHEIHLHVDGEEQILVVADKDAIEQVISSYLHNSIKYAPDTTPVHIMITRHGQRVKVEVQDQGPGLSTTEQSKVWERFYQVPDRTIYTGSAGMGLGLYISQVIIRQHHGRVGVESQMGQGSSFWFTLPLAH